MRRKPNARARKQKGRQQRELGSLRKTGAGNESRTRDLNLGKVALYQLSYSREEVKLWHKKDAVCKRLIKKMSCRKNGTI
jgi:CDP-diacylglycerol-glycerol-3-phosphate 3-phosphatidyltransferase